LVNIYRRFGTTCRSHLKGPNSLLLRSSNPRQSDRRRCDRHVSRNVGK